MSVTYAEELPERTFGEECLDRILEPLCHPDVLIALPTVISRLQQASGEEWAIGDALRHALATISGSYKNKEPVWKKIPDELHEHPQLESEPDD